MIEQIKLIIATIGYLGSQILAIISIYLLIGKPIYLITFVVGLFLNSSINFFIKWVRKFPRPKGDYTLAGKSNTGTRIGSDKYGFPSGHAQHVAFATTYMYYVLENINISMVFLILSINTLFQRVIYKNNFLYQVVGGSILGFIFAHYLYKYAKKNNEKNVKKLINELI